MVKNMNTVSDGIKKVVSELMESVLNKVLEIDPFLPEKHHAKKPLYAALVPDEIFKGSHFERRFVTPFGSVWEKLAQVVAEAHLGKVSLQESIEGNIKEGRLKRIQEILNAEDHATKDRKKRKPNWEEDLAYIMQGGGNPIPVSVICDLTVINRLDRKKYAFELKAPLPNSDQSKVSKEKILKLMAMDNHPVEQAFFALVYNPYGTREDYDWSYPKRWFDFKEDKCLLIGDELWNFLGGVGTYQKFIDEINTLGVKYKEIIYRDYLKIDPPAQSFELQLK